MRAGCTSSCSRRPHRRRHRASPHGAATIIPDMDPLEPAHSALMVGDVKGAAEAAQRAVDEDPDSPAAHELLGTLCASALDDYDRARSHFEASYRHFRRLRKMRDAARLAIRLAVLEDTAGNETVMRGWLSRARRLIDEVGHCVEEGYYWIALVGCSVPDVGELETLAARALEVAREFGDPDLEIKALTDSGLALVSQGRVEAGLARLDEAAAALLAGETRDLTTTGLAACSVVSACERLGDVERLLRFKEGLDRVFNERYRGFYPPIHLTHCRQAYGGMLGEAGLWQEAEAELLRALECSQCVGHRASALARLGQIRVNQNRVDEAAELLRGWEDRWEVQRSLAILHDVRGELELAASTLRWALRQRGSDLLSSAPLYAHLADIEARRGELDAADEAAGHLERIASLVASPTIQAMALLARGRVRIARGGSGGVESLEAALAQLQSIDRPLLRAEIHLALASAKREPAPADAVADARAALAICERLGARRQLDRATALLRELGIRVRPAPTSLPGIGLSRREREVAVLVAQGLSNAEIGARLFVSPKTVEHHVTAVLGKLGLSKRAEVAAWATQRREVLASP